MNERFKELMSRAGFDPVAIERMGVMPQAEKFVELIVRECCEVAKNPQWYSESPSDGWRNPIRHVCGAMKDHFGVEE